MTVRHSGFSVPTSCRDMHCLADAVLCGAAPAVGCGSQRFFRTFPRSFCPPLPTHPPTAVCTAAPVSAPPPFPQATHPSHLPWAAAALAAWGGVLPSAAWNWEHPWTCSREEEGHAMLLATPSAVMGGGSSVDFWSSMGLWTLEGAQCHWPRPLRW